MSDLPYQRRGAMVWFSGCVIRVTACGDARHIKDRERSDQHRHTGEAKIGTRGRAILHEHLEKVLADLITDDVRKDLRGRGKTAVQIPPDLLVQHVAATFVQVLNWWMDSRSPLPAKEVNDLFRALILPTLTATWE